MPTTVHYTHYYKYRKYVNVISVLFKTLYFHVEPFRHGSVSEWKWYVAFSSRSGICKLDITIWGFYFDVIIS